MVWTIVALAPERHLLLQGGGLGEALAAGVDDGQALAGPHRFLGVIALRLDEDRERLQVQALGPGQVIVVALHPREIPEQLRHLRAALAPLLPLDREGVLVQGRRLVELALIVGHVRDPGQGLGHRHAARPVELLAPFQVGPQQGKGVIVLAELEVDVGDQPRRPPTAPRA